jgi:hypothetical protein
MFPIEIKVNVEGAIDEAIRNLVGDPHDVEMREIWFAEDRFGVADGTLPLLDGGVIVRFRIGDGSDDDDLTVKLRPCEERQLVGHWSESTKNGKFEYRIEHDWAADRPVLAASAVSQRRPGSLADELAPGADAANALNDAQRHFISECARPGVHADRLIALGPIASTKWSKVRLDEFKVNVERWTAGELDFLEVSVHVEPETGEAAESFTARVAAAQRALHQSVERHGVTISQRNENKTQRVLNALAKAQRERLANNPR